MEGRESVAEAKVYREEWQYEKGLKQIQHYAESLNAYEAITNQAGKTQTLTYGARLQIFHINYDTEKGY